MYNITKGKKWIKAGVMKIPRKGHACVSITTSIGEQLMAVGGLDTLENPISEVELFDPVTRTWNIDEQRSLPFLIKKYLLSG